MDGFSPDLLLALDAVPERSLRARFEQALRRAILDGRLAAGARLPSSRSLATELGISRNVVATAYTNLVEDGFLEARRGSGTRVRATAAPARATDGSEAGTGGASGDGDGATASWPAAEVRPPGRVIRLFSGIPDPLAFPRNQWRRHHSAVLGELRLEDQVYPDPRGALALRSALGTYLGRVRGVVASPEATIVCGGVTQAIALVCRAMRRRGARAIAVEDPCFHLHRRQIANAGLRVVPIPVGDDGLDPARLASHDGIGAVLISPAHSFPTGAVLSAERREALIRWCESTDAYVIEDDYDAEFRYDRSPIGALQGLGPGRVVYAGTTSKVLGPYLRIGWIVAPAALLDALIEQKFLEDISTGLFDQLVLARFIDCGHFARHLRLVRPRYRRRRDVTVAAVARHLPGSAVRGIAAGLHVYVELPEGTSEASVVDAARQEGVYVEGGAWHWADPGSAPPTLLLGYGAATETQLVDGVAALGRALAGSGAGPSSRARSRPAVAGAQLRQNLLEPARVRPAPRAEQPHRGR